MWPFAKEMTIGQILINYNHNLKLWKRTLNVQFAYMKHNVYHLMVSQ